MDLGRAHLDPSESTAESPGKGGGEFRLPSTNQNSDAIWRNEPEGRLPRGYMAMEWTYLDSSIGHWPAR